MTAAASGARSPEREELTLNDAATDLLEEWRARS
jgi:hypothetical protein